MRRRVVWLAIAAGAALVGCDSESDGSDATPEADAQAGGQGGGGGGAPADAGAGGSPDPALMCPVTNFVAEPGLESCFACMLTECCAEVQACDSDPDCVFCEDNPIDSSERCVDPRTFTVYPNRRAVADCQTERCVPPCGVDGGSSCTPGDCAASCFNFDRNCQ